MSKEYSTALKLGASAPFFLIRKLSKEERSLFIEVVSPTLLTACKYAFLKVA